MRRFSLRSLLAAVALAIQALSVVYALGAPPAGAHGRGDSAYCEAIDGSSDRRAPIGGHRDAGACLACQSCLAGFSPFLPYSVAAHPLDPARRRRGGMDVRRDDRASASVSPMRTARAPPASPDAMTLRPEVGGVSLRGDSVEARQRRRTIPPSTPIIVETTSRRPSRAVGRDRSESARPEGAGGQE